MESTNILRGLLRSWWLILLVVVAGGGGGYAIYHHAIPLYRSSVSLVVAPKTPGTDQVSAQALAGAQAQALAQVATTPPAIRAAAIRAGHAQAQPAVSAAANAEQPFVYISVVDSDPVIAQSVADAFARTIAASKDKLLGPSSIPFTLTRLAPANDPGAPFSPSFKRDLGLGLAVGLAIGVALALLRETLNRAIRESDELQRITGLTVLGTIPRELPKVLLPAVTHPRSARAEAYRQIRTSLLNASDARPMTITVTSPSMGEGKTSVSTNLAAVFSRAGHRVALVDADLRRPRVAAFWELEADRGLSDVLAGIVPLQDALSIHDDGRLAILGSGRIPANPSEALGSAAMTAVLAQLAADYEFIIVDTPPVLPVTDALVLAPDVDGVVLVARLGATTRERILHAKTSLERVNARILGVVPNQAGKGSDSDYRYPYRYSPTGRKTQDVQETIPTEHLQDLGTLARTTPDPEPAPEQRFRRGVPVLAEEPAAARTEHPGVDVDPSGTADDEQTWLFDTPHDSSGQL